MGQMQSISTKARLRDRAEAGYQLSQLLTEYKNSNGVVVGIPNGGVPVAAAIAEALSLPLEVMPCKTIKHPADAKENIGSVSVDDVFVHDCSHSIPQDYIYHQIVLLRNAISYARRNYYGLFKPQSLQYRPVILVDDFLTKSDKMMACLRSIRKQNPIKIVVAVPIVATEAARVVAAEADDIRFLKMETSPGRADSYFADFSKVDEDTVRWLLEASRKAEGNTSQNSIKKNER
jgi:putative phosphoribosyl transferase